MLQKLHKGALEIALNLCRHTKSGKRWKKPLIFSEMMVK